MNTKIAVIGVPGSGKTEFANALSDFLVSHDGLCRQCNTPVGIVDDYAEDASKEIDLATAFAASWYLDLFISLKRVALERQLIKENKTVITCGTIIESSVYAMVNFSSRMDFKLENEKVDEAKRIQAAMMTFACLFMDTFAYDRVYFLNPVRPATEYVEQLQNLDKGVRSSFEGFQLTKTAKDLTVDETDIAKATEMRLEMVKGDFLDESEGQGEELEVEGSE
jgi:hypothetical protein